MSSPNVVEVNSALVNPSVDFWQPVRDVQQRVASAWAHVDVVVSDYLRNNLGLSEEVHAVAMRLFRALPETVVAVAVFSGFCGTVAALYMLARVAYVLTPSIKAVFSDITPAEKSKIHSDTFKEAVELLKNYIPALATGAAIMAMKSFMVGILKLVDVVELARGFLYATASGFILSQLMPNNPIRLPAPDPVAGSRSELPHCAPASGISTDQSAPIAHASNAPASSVRIEDVTPPRESSSATATASPAVVASVEGAPTIAQANAQVTVTVQPSSGSPAMQMD